MASPIEVLPGDRPIFMIGQPIIRLFASGGPGGALGDYEVPLPGRSGVYPKKVRDMVSFDDTLGCCGNEYSLADLACVGSGESGMGAETPEAAAKATSDHCKGLDERITKLSDEIKKAESSKALTKAQKAEVTSRLRQQVKALRLTFRSCLGYLKGLVRGYRKRIDAAGLSDVVKYSEKKSALEECKDRVALFQKKFSDSQKRYDDHMKTHHGKR
jgi:hypothetical protein